VDPENETPGDDSTFLVADMRISCTSSYYYWGVLYSLLMILVYPVGIPLLYLYSLYHYRDEIQGRPAMDDVVSSDVTIIPSSVRKHNAIAPAPISAPAPTVTPALLNAAGETSTPADSINNGSGDDDYDIHFDDDSSEISDMDSDARSDISFASESHGWGEQVKVVPQHPDQQSEQESLDQATTLAIDSTAAAAATTSASSVTASEAEEESSPGISPGAERLKFLWKAYEPQFWYWEVIETTRRLMLTAVLSIIGPGSPPQSVVAIMLALIYMKIYAVCEPYDDFTGKSCSLLLHLDCDQN
jgi:hypothetical protein